MSFQAQTDACALRGLKPLDKYLLMTLANYADADGSCFPSQSRLADDTGLSERSVRSHLDALEEQGLIVRTARRRADGSRASDRIILSISNRKELPVGGSATGTSCRGVGQEVPGGGAGAAGLTTFEPVIEPINEPITLNAPATRECDQVLDQPLAESPKAKRASRGKPPPTPAEQAAFDAFWAIYPRREAKQTALEAFLREVRAGIDPIAIASGAQAYAEDRAGQDQKFTAHAATWLNQKRWTDEIAPPATSRPGRPMEGYCALDQAMNGIDWDAEIEEAE